GAGSGTATERSGRPGAGSREPTASGRDVVATTATRPVPTSRATVSETRSSRGPLSSGAAGAPGATASTSSSTSTAGGVVLTELSAAASSSAAALVSRDARRWHRTCTTRGADRGRDSVRESGLPGAGGPREQDAGLRRGPEAREQVG